MNAADRALKYILKIHSVEGQHGDDAVFHAACICAEGFGLSAGEMRPLMMQWNQSNASPPWTEARIDYKIKQAQKLAAGSSNRGHMLQNGASESTRYRAVMPGKPQSHDSHIANEPLPDEITSVSALLRAGFKAGEHISMCKAKWYEDTGKAGPEHSGVVQTREFWLEKAAAAGDSLEKWMGSEHGAFIRCNPIKPEDPTDKGVTSFRHAVLEFDSGTEAEQWGRIKSSGLPITAVIHSGGKSLHAWVRLDAKDRTEYDQRVKVLLAAFPDADQKVAKNPNRFSRLPGITRQGKRQRLLAVDQGALDWESWPKPKDVRTTDTPAAAKTESLDYIYIEDLITKYPVLRKPLIHGLLREGETMNIIAAPKTGKSWLAGDLALSVGTGQEWMGFKLNQGKVWLIDNELHAETLADRMRILAAARQLSPEQYKGQIAFTNLRGKLKDINVMASMFSQIKESGFKVVVLDALYRFYGERMDENSNADMARLYNTIDQCAESMGCSFVLVHHMSRGYQGGKSITDRGAGGGAQSRAADCHVTLTPHGEDENVIVFESVVRSWPAIQPFCLRREFPLWAKAAEVEPTTKREEPTKPFQKKTTERVYVTKRQKKELAFREKLKVEAVTGQGALNLIVEIYGVEERQAKNIWKSLRETTLKLDTEPPTYTYLNIDTETGEIKE